MFSKNESTSKQSDDLKSKHFEERGNDTNQQASPKDPLDISTGLIIRPETIWSKRNWLGLFWIFGLTSCKSIRLDLYVLFGSFWVFKLTSCKTIELDLYILFGLYMKLQVKFCYDFDWAGNKTS